jgi:hypothetical protein
MNTTKSLSKGGVMEVNLMGNKKPERLCEDPPAWCRRIVVTCKDGG